MAKRQYVRLSVEQLSKIKDPRVALLLLTGMEMGPESLVTALDFVRRWGITGEHFTEYAEELIKIGYAAWPVGMGMTAINIKTQSPAPQSVKPKFKFTKLDLKIANGMYDQIKRVYPGARKPDLEKWANEIRLMQEQDGHRLKDIQQTFSQALKDNFWCKQIRSPANLRKHWDKMKMQWIAKPLSGDPMSADL